MTGIEYCCFLFRLHLCSMPMETIEVHDITHKTSTNKVFAFKLLKVMVGSTWQIQSRSIFHVLGLVYKPNSIET